MTMLAASAGLVAAIAALLGILIFAIAFFVVSLRSYQRRVHLGCRVPFCAQSQWFECPCHGSKYNQAGEYQLGPAPRGMDRFHMEVAGGRVMVDTSEVVLGPARGTDTIDQPPQGAFCVAAG